MTGFIWPDVIENIAAISDQELIEAGITLHAIQPLLAQDCRTPLMFPSRNPTITVQAVKPLTFGKPTNGGRRAKGQTQYTLDWIYLHVEYTQQLNTREHERAIQRNLAAIFRALVRHRSMLGVNWIIPQSAEIDYNLADPTSGKQFLGAHVVLSVNEIYEL